MINRDISALAVAGGHPVAVTAPAPARWGLPAAGIVARMPGVPSAPGLSQAALAPRYVTRGRSALPREKHFANEHDAADYACAMTRRGYDAQVQYDVYDYSWSVEVQAGRLPGHGRHA